MQDLCSIQNNSFLNYKKFNHLIKSISMNTQPFKAIMLIIDISFRRSDVMINPLAASRQNVELIAPFYLYG